MTLSCTARGVSRHTTYRSTRRSTIGTSHNTAVGAPPQRRTSVRRGAARIAPAPTGSEAARRNRDGRASPQAAAMPARRQAQCTDTCRVLSRPSPMLGRACVLSRAGGRVARACMRGGTPACEAARLLSRATRRAPLACGTPPRWSRPTCRRRSARSCSRGACWPPRRRATSGSRSRPPRPPATGTGPSHA